MTAKLCTGELHKAAEWQYRLVDFTTSHFCNTGNILCDPVCSSTKATIFTVVYLDII